MTFTASGTPDITESLPATLSARVANTQATFRNIKFDVTIGGIGFCLDPDGSPYTLRGSYIRQSVATQKSQQDASKEPGEQTLDGFWIRSQSSWHRGAGINFYEPGSDPDTEYRFSESSGVDVWTRGTAMTLPALKLDTAATGNCYVMDAGNGYYAISSDTGLIGWALGSAGYTLNTPPAGYNGRYYFFGYQKYVKVGWVSPASATVGIWNGGTNTVIAKNATVEPHVWYFKDRLIVAHGANLFEVPLNSATPVDLSSATAALYAPTDAGTSWVSAADGPNGIYLACTDGRTDGIYRFGLQDSSGGQTPKLSQAYRVLDLPAGERIYSMFGYLGRYLLISTSAGIRICALDSSGNITMGQVTIPAAVTGKLNSFHADSNFVYVGGADVPQPGTTGGTGNLPGFQNAAGFIRINLGEPIGDTNALRFAYANDTRTTVTGTVTSSVRIGDQQQAIAVAGSGVWVTDTANHVPSGYLAMGRVRYDTVVPKVFHSLDMGGALGTGSFKVELFDETDTSQFALTMDPSTGVFPTIALDLTKTHYSLRLIGTFNWVSGAPPQLNLVQFRSMPSPKRIRQIRLPMKCQDKEQDSGGVAFGKEGYAYARVAALEALEESGVPVEVKDFRSGETFTAMIDEIQFHGVTAADRKEKNYGGHITITLTKLS